MTVKTPIPSLERWPIDWPPAAVRRGGWRGIRPTVPNVATLPAEWALPTLGRVRVRIYPVNRARAERIRQRDRERTAEYRARRKAGVVMQFDTALTASKTGTDT